MVIGQISRVNSTRKVFLHDLLSTCLASCEPFLRVCGMRVCHWLAAGVLYHCAVCQVRAHMTILCYL